MKKCSNCQMIVDDRATYCPRCGYSFNQKVTNPFLYCFFIISVVFLISLVLYSLLASTIEKAIVDYYYDTEFFYQKSANGIDNQPVEATVEDVVEIADSVASAVDEDVAEAPADAAEAAADAVAEDDNDNYANSFYDNFDGTIYDSTGPLGEDKWISFGDGTTDTLPNGIECVFNKKSYNKKNHEIVYYAYNVNDKNYEGKFVGKYYYEGHIYKGIFTDKEGNAMKFEFFPIDE